MFRLFRNPVFFFLFVFLATACDDCSKVECQNGAICNEGTCECPLGIVGSDCETNLCDVFDCQNGGVLAPTATSCSCNCPAAYEGDNCETEVRAKFLGNFLVDELCDSGTDLYKVVISESPDATDHILITNFYDVFSNPVKVHVHNSTELMIHEQEPDGDGVTVSGTGLTEDGGNILMLDFLVTIDTLTDHCVATYSRQ